MTPFQTYLTLVGGFALILAFAAVVLVVIGWVEGAITRWRDRPRYKRTVNL